MGDGMQAVPHGCAFIRRADNAAPTFHVGRIRRIQRFVIPRGNAPWESPGTAYDDKLPAGRLPRCFAPRNDSGGRWRQTATHIFPPDGGGTPGDGVPCGVRIPYAVGTLAAGKFAHRGQIFPTGRRGRRPLRNTNSIRRVENSEQSRGPNGVIRPPDPQNESALAPAQYAERKIATSREGPMVLFNHQTIRTNWLRPLAGKCAGFCALFFNFVQANGFTRI